MARCGGAVASAGPGAAPPADGGRGAWERRRLKEMVAEQLRQDLGRLLKEEICADVTFCVGHTLFRAHKSVLLARVPEFFIYSTGKQSSNLKDHETFHLEHFEPSEFKTFLQNMDCEQLSGILISIANTGPMILLCLQTLNK